MSNATWTWEKTETGYRASDGRAELVKRLGKRGGSSWVLVMAHGTEYPLPRRASFDHAEALLASLEG